MLKYASDVLLMCVFSAYRVVIRVIIGLLDCTRDASKTSYPSILFCYHHTWCVGARLDHHSDGNLSGHAPLLGVGPAADALVCLTFSVVCAFTLPLLCMEQQHQHSAS